MRKNRIARYCAALCGAMIALAAFLGAFGPTSARYYSKAAMSGDFDYVKILGTISLYHPEWVGGYNQKTGVFEVPDKRSNYENIHYAVNSAVDDETNEEDVIYYVRIVAEDGGDALPITYDVHEYPENPEEPGYNKLPVVEDSPVQGKGYGPFTLEAGSAKKFLFSIKADGYSDQFVNEHKLQKLRVQMVTEKKNGGLRVIAEAPLQMQFVGYTDPVQNPVVPVKFYNAADAEVSSTTVTMNSDSEGNCTYTFDTKRCRELCPELADKKSFTVYIANQWNSAYEVGNATDNTSVDVDYNKTYTTSWADFKLTDEGAYIKIIAWQ